MNPKQFNEWHLVIGLLLSALVGCLFGTWVWGTSAGAVVGASGFSLLTIVGIIWVEEG